MKWKILLTLAFPGIYQVSEGNLKVGLPLLILNGLFQYALWLIFMPIALGLMFKSERDQKKGPKKETWKQEVETILAETYTES